MPELPDVEVFKRYFDATALHKEITDVTVEGPEVLEGVDASRLSETLTGHEFEQTRRHGKDLFVQLDDRRWLRLHFGMTGNLKYFKAMAKEPDYDQVLISFDNGYHLAYTAPRKLGHVALVDDVDAFVEDHNLGPDVASEDFDFETFKSLLDDRGGMIKSALMDQTLMAGIGNVYSDEILFQARIHPRTQVQSLSGEELRDLYDAMQEVLETAIDHQTDIASYPDKFLLPHRESEGTCPHCGEPLERVKVSGRTAYYCPNRQGSEPR